MWNLNEAVSLIRRIEPALSAAGYHCGLTGGVLFKGESVKDLDIIIYPHKYSLGLGFDLKPARAIIESIFNPVEKCNCESTSQLRDDKLVSWIKTEDGKRIDFFFLK